jgi:hypothetical protein
VADIPIRDHHYRSRQRPVKSPLTGRVYRCELKSGLYLFMADERDLDLILNIRKGCCGASGKFYKLATPEEYEKWKNG